MLDIIENLFKLIFELLTEIFKLIFNISPPRKTELDANFLKTSKLLSRWNKGFCLNGTKHLTIKQSHMSAMVLGGSGSGKTVSVAIPTIFNLAKNGHSLFIHDPSSELNLATSGYLEHLGYKIKIINYANPKISDGYNPMFRSTSASEIQKVATLLVRNSLGENNKDPFWQTQSVLLLSLIMRVLQKNNFWFQNLANVKRILDNMTIKPESMDILVAQCNDEPILTEYKQFLIMDKKLLTSIISTARASLSIFTDPEVQVVTSFDSIDIDSFRKEKTALYINNSTGNIKYYSVLSGIMMEQCFSSLMDKLPSKEDKNVFFIIDESSSLYLPSMQIALSNLRKYKAGIMNIAQDFNQFIHLYGSYESEAIKTNSYSKVFFPGQPLNTAQELEKLLGTFEFEDDKGVRRTRNLMFTDEIRSMQENTSLIIAGAKRAIFTQMKPYYRNRKLKRMSSYPTSVQENKIPFDELPLIPLPTKLK